MKKIIMICIVAAFATSCKKDRTCVCTSTDTSNGVTETTVDTFKAKTNKKDADAWCKAIPKSTVDGVASGTNETCELK